MTDEKKAAGSFANKAYAAAEKALRGAHTEEFEALLQKEYDDAGVSRVRRLSAEERAAKDAEEREAKAAAKEAARREKARATAEALAHEFPDLVSVAPVNLDAPSAF